MRSRMSGSAWSRSQLGSSMMWASASCTTRPRLLYGMTRMLRVHLATTLKRPAERELVGVLQVAPDREPGRDAGDLQPERLQQPGQVHGRGLALDVGVRAEDDLG